MLSGLFGEEDEEGGEASALGLLLVAATRAAAPPPPRAQAQLVGLDNQVGGPGAWVGEGRSRERAYKAHTSP